MVPYCHRPPSLPRPLCPSWLLWGLNSAKWKIYLYEEQPFSEEFPHRHFILTKYTFISKEESFLSILKNFFLRGWITYWFCFACVEREQDNNVFISEEQQRYFGSLQGVLCSIIDIDPRSRPDNQPTKPSATPLKHNTICMNSQPQKDFQYLVRLLVVSTHSIMYKKNILFPCFCSFHFNVGVCTHQAPSTIGTDWKKVIFL